MEQYIKTYFFDYIGYTIATMVILIWIVSFCIGYLTARLREKFIEKKKVKIEIADIKAEMCDKCNLIVREREDLV